MLLLSLNTRATIRGKDMESHLLFRLPENNLHSSHKLNKNEVIFWNIVIYSFNDLKINHIYHNILMNMYPLAICFSRLRFYYVACTIKVNRLQRRNTLRSFCMGHPQARSQVTMRGGGIFRQVDPFHMVPIKASIPFKGLTTFLYVNTTPRFGGKVWQPRPPD
jgi:hypothetical protein